MVSEMAVDGQQMFLLDDLEWERAVALGEWRQIGLVSPGTRPLLEAMLRFSRSRREAFRLAICRDSDFIKYWHVIHLIKTSYGWQRVHVERVTCSTCGINQWIANPTVADLYLGVLDWFDARERAMSAGPIPCIGCGAPLPRFAVWSEVYKSE